MRSGRLIALIVMAFCCEAAECCNRQYAGSGPRLTASISEYDTQLFGDGVRRAVGDARAVGVIFPDASTDDVGLACRMACNPQFPADVDWCVFRDAGSDVSPTVRCAQFPRASRCGP